MFGIAKRVRSDMAAGGHHCKRSSNDGYTGSAPLKPVCGSSTAPSCSFRMALAHADARLLTFGPTSFLPSPFLLDPLQSSVKTVGVRVNVGSQCALVRAGREGHPGASQGFARAAAAGCGRAGDLTHAVADGCAETIIGAFRRDFFQRRVPASLTGGRCRSGRYCLSLSSNLNEIFSLTR